MNQLSRVAAIALAACAAVLGSAAPAASAHGVSSSTHAAATAAVTVDLTPSFGGDLGAGQPLRATVTVNNPTQLPTVAGTATLTVDPTAFTSRSSLADWFSGTSKSNLATETIASSPVTAIAAQTSGAFELIAPATALPFETAGVYGLSVTISDGSTVIGTARTAIAWSATSANAVPVAIAVPLTVPAGSSTFLTAAQLTEYTAPNGILTRELASVTGTDMAVGIDPRIIASIRVLGKSAPTSATAWLTSLTNLTNETFPLAWADADITAPLHLGAPAVLEPKTLTYAIDPTQFPVTGDSTATPAPGSGGGGSFVPTSAELVAWNYTMPKLQWPTANSVEPSDLKKLNAAGITSAIVTSANVDDPDSKGLAGASGKSGSTTLAVSDDVLSGYLRTAVQSADRSASEVSLTELTTTLALIGLEAGTSPHAILLTLDPNWATNDPSFIRTISDLYDVSWTTPVNLSSVFTATPASVTLDKDAEPASRLQQVQQVLSAESTVDTFSPIAVNPSAITSSYRLQVLSLLSNEWLDSPTAWSTAVQAFVNQSDKTLRSVQVSKSDALLLLSDQTSLPISITNGLDQDVTVTLTVRPSSPNITIDRDDSVQTLTISANSEKRVEIPLEALSNGKAHLTVSLASKTGQPVGDTVTLNITVQAGWETLGTLIFVALVVALFAFGVVRNIRKRRRESAAEATDGPHE